MNGDKWNGKEYDDRGYLDAKYTNGKRKHLGCYIIWCNFKLLIFKK